MSRPLFGYTPKGVPIEKELEALEEVQHLINDDALSLREGSEYILISCGRSISHVGLRDRLAKGVYIDRAAS